MPILKYRCAQCGKEFAKILVNTGNAPKQCPVCSAPSPVEIGEAFTYDATSLNRYACDSCDSCGVEASCQAARSS